MDTSPTSFLSEILEGIEGPQIPKHKLVYFRARLRNRIFDMVLSEFVRLQEEMGVSKADLARRIGRDAAQISRWLSEPSNLTLDTVSDLLVAMKSEPSLGIQAVGAQLQEAQSAADLRKSFIAAQLLSSRWLSAPEENVSGSANGGMPVLNPQMLVGNSSQEASQI